MPNEEQAQALAMKRLRFWQIIGEMPVPEPMELRKKGDEYINVPSVDYVLAARRKEIVDLAVELGIRLEWQVQHLLTLATTTVSSHEEAVVWAAGQDAQWRLERKAKAKAEAALKREAAREKKKISPKQQKKIDLGYARMKMFAEEEDRYEYA